MFQYSTLEYLIGLWSGKIVMLHYRCPTVRSVVRRVLVQHQQQHRNRGLVVIVPFWWKTVVTLPNMWSTAHLLRPIFALMTCKARHFDCNLQQQQLEERHDDLCFWHNHVLEWLWCPHPRCSCSLWKKRERSFFLMKMSIISIVLLKFVPSIELIEIDERQWERKWGKVDSVLWYYDTVHNHLNWL